MIIGSDLDGTITPYSFYDSDAKFPLPWWLACFLVPVILFSKPKKAVVEKMRLMAAQGYKFIIVTRWPNQFFRFIKWLLMRHRVPFAGLFCVGFGKGADERKLKVIREEKVDIFVDSSRRFVRFLKRNSVQATASFDYLN